MLEHNELARALTELPDELLLEAEHPAQPRNPIKFRRLIVAAAVIAMLAVTVGAVSTGLAWNVEKETYKEVVQKFGAVDEDYYKDPDGSLGFEKLEYTIPLGVVELKQRNMDDLKDLLRRHWNLTQHPDYATVYEALPEREFVYDSQSVDHFMTDFMGRYHIARPVSTFETLEDVENLLGILLDVPLELRKAIRQAAEDNYSNVISVRIYTGTTEAQAAETKGTLEPSNVVINIQLPMYATNASAHATIRIPLTEQTAQEGIQGLHYSYEKEGSIWQEEQTIGEWTVSFFGNDPQEGYDGWCEAVYTSGGIGYTLSSRRDADIPNYSPNWPYYNSAKELLLSLFADAE